MPSPRDRLRRPSGARSRVKIGAAIKIEENVPTTMPKLIASANGLMISPARKESTSAVAGVVPPVRTVRGSVSSIDTFRTSERLRLRY
jgi:hypothetical protein